MGQFNEPWTRPPPAPNPSIDVQAKIKKYVGPPYCRAEMYAGRVACCPWWVTVSMPTG